MSFQQAMCHKLNTPLHQAIMAIQCLIAENQASEHRSEEEDSMLQIAVEALGSLHIHVEKILHHTFVSRSFRRVVDGMRVLRMEQIIREVYDVIPMTKQLEVNVMAEASDVRYRISEEAFSMVMRELFDNAVKFHPDQAPSVRVDIRVENGSFLELVFMDQGWRHPNSLGWHGLTLRLRRIRPATFLVWGWDWRPLLWRCGNLTVWWNLGTGRARAVW